MSADHELHTGRQEPAPAIAAAADRGDPAAVATMKRYEHRMARALAGVINVLDPDVIVLGGGMSNIERLYTHVPRIWGDYVFAATGTRAIGMSVTGSSAIRTRLVRARHGDTSGVRGAAWLWADGLPAGSAARRQ
jgi:fructokinase